MDFRTLLQSMHNLSEATKETDTGKIHTADPGGYGRKDDEDEDGKPVKPAAPAVKRGKGRPPKAADSSGQVKKADWSAFGVSGKDIKLKPWDKKKTVKHSLKDWIESAGVDMLAEGRVKQLQMDLRELTDQEFQAQYKMSKAEARAGLADKKPVSEEGGITIKPMPGASQIIGADGKPMGTADAATANTIKQASEKGTLNLGGDEEQMNEKWDAKMDTPASEKGKYAGKSKSELLKAYNHLKSTGPHKEGSKPYSNMKELSFAIRAKGKFGKVKEEGKLDELDASTVASYQDKAFDKYMGGDEKRAQGLDRASKKQAGAFGHVPTTQPQNVEETKNLPGKQEKLDVAPPKGKLTGADFKALAKKKVKESLSFTEMMQEAGTDVSDMMSELQQDIDTFNKTGHCSDKLEAFLKIHGHSKKKMTDEGAKADFTTHGMDSKPASFNMVPANPEPTSWKVDPIQATTDRVIDAGERAGSFLRNLTAPKKTFESKDMKDVQLESWEKELNTLLSEGITITSSQGQQGSPDSVSINATDSDAQELLSIVRQAGLGVFGGGDEQSHSGYGAPMSGDEGGNGAQPEASPTVVGDGDDMMALIKKMSGIQSGPTAGFGDEEHEEHGQDGPEGTLTPDYENEVDEGNDPQLDHYHDLVAGGMDPDQAEEEAYQNAPEDDEDGEVTDEGNAFSGAVAKAKSDNIPNQDQKFKVGKKEYPVKEQGQVPEMGEEQVDGDGAYQKATGGSCNECGMFETRCVCGSGKEQVEEYANDAGNEQMAQLKHMLGQGNDLHREKHSQAVGNPTKVTFETKLLKDSSNLLVDWKKLSGIK
jgi:hypothetical protein